MIKSAEILAEIGQERQRQQEKEGYDTAHDDYHDFGELSGAGAAYALNASCQLYPHCAMPLDEKPESFIWDEKHWKPKTPRKDLLRAAALIVAEIEKIDRHVESNPPVCIGCGCDDMHACVDDVTEQPCHWLAVDPIIARGVCSACPGEMARWERGDCELSQPKRVASK